MSDLISRQDAIDAIPQTSVDAFENCRNCELLDREQVVEILESLPSADRPTGKWAIEERDCIYGQKYILTCSECGDAVSVTESSLPHEKYCRNCGARMQRGEIHDKRRSD